MQQLVRPSRSTRKLSTRETKTSINSRKLLELREEWHAQIKTDRKERLQRLLDVFCIETYSAFELLPKKYISCEKRVSMTKLAGISISQL